MRKTATWILSLFLGCTASYVSAKQLYTLDVQDFTTLEVVDDLNVICLNSADSAGLAVFESTPEMVSTVVFKNSKNKLKIEKNIDLYPDLKDFPVITVYSSALVSAENCGDSTLTVVAPTPGSLFKARVIGNGTLIATDIHATQAEGTLDTGKGHLVMEGLTRNVKLKNIGTGRIEAAGLKAETGSVTILGTGPIDCNVSDELTVKGLGTGKVYLLGHPKVKKMTVGTISVINME